MNWTKEELIYLKENYPKKVSLDEIARYINKSIWSIKHKAARMKISRPRFSLNPENRQSRKAIDKKYYEENKEKVYQRKITRRKKLKLEMVNILGGKCSKCGYTRCNAALEFHHKGDKEKEIANLLKNDSREKILKEAKKCILLCANCHRELHHNGSVVQC